MTDLSERDAALTELMDDPHCDRRTLDRTYARFGLVNGLVAGWRRVYRMRIAPLLVESPVSVLDVGAGGGDVARALLRWARGARHPLTVTAIDPDARAFAALAARPARGLTVRNASSADLVAEGARFDVVVSNHLLHHLDDAALAAVADDSVRLAARLVVHNDLRRSTLAYRLYGAAVLPIAPGTFLRTDGLRSIRRSHTPTELAARLPVGWRVESFGRFRLLAVHETPSVRPGEQPGA